MPRSIPLARAMEIIFLAKPMDAKTAYDFGLINRVVPKDKVMEVATEWAERICEMGPLAVRAAKACIYRGLNMSLEDGLKLEDQYAEYITSTEDALEGPMSFMEKRKPNFKGK